VAVDMRRNAVAFPQNGIEDGSARSRKPDLVGNLDQTE